MKPLLNNGQKTTDKDNKMALPLIAAGIAARAIAKKVTTRAAGGITGGASKSVNPVYREIGSSVKVVKPTSDAARATKNAAETMRVTGAKSGTTSALHSAITSAGKNLDKSMGKKTSTIKIKSK
jgi:hypothetical protein